MTIAREAVLALVKQALVDALAEKGKAPPADLSPDTEVFGRGALLDSLGLVTMVMELETRLEEEHGVSVGIVPGPAGTAFLAASAPASEKAMSRRSSPFRTLGSLVDYIVQQAEQGAST